MDYASIESGASHRKSKKFKQRLKYRLDQGYSYEEAYALASAKLRLVPKAPSSELTDENLPQSSAQNTCKYLPAETKIPVDEKSSEEPQALQLMTSVEPSADEVHRLVTELKTKGLMTEIPSLPKIVSEAGAIAGKSAGQPVQNKSSILESEKLYWVVASMASLWLTLAMIESLSGHPALNLLVAISFSFGPMLILAPKLSDKDQKIAKWGAGIVFVLDAMLYLLPSAQVLWNESKAYYLSSSTYISQSAQYQSQQNNSVALVEETRLLSENAKRDFDKTRADYGADNWRTKAAKTEYEKKLRDWKLQSEKLTALPQKASSVPKLSQAMTEAAQALAIRIGLFLVVYLLMFVRQQRVSSLP